MSGAPFARSVERQRERGRLQRQLALDFIERHIAEHGWPPTVREVAEALEVTVTTAHSHLRGLVAEGRIVTGGGPRMIRVTNGRIQTR
jgi:repressor LexA